VCRALMGGHREEEQMKSGAFEKPKSEATSNADNDSSDAVEVIPKRLYWATISSPAFPRNTARSHYYSTDKTIVYEPFFADFGPFNLGQTFRYCQMLHEKLHDPALQGKRIIHCCSMDPHFRTNAAFLICAYSVIIRRQPADVAFAPFNFANPPLVPYRDATANPNSLFPLTVLDCLRGLEYSMHLKLFDWTCFNVESYDYFEQVKNGDLSWILPGKMLAFAGPSPNSPDADGYPAWTPEDYVSVFSDAGIQLVVRLNRKMYDRKRFINNGIKHVDLYFPDGTCPPPEIIHKFLAISENEHGPLGVHCKAGLGRTGTLIGLFAMKLLRFPARAFIGWCRICRPGSILGPQQQFLVDMQAVMFQAGAMMHLPHQIPTSTEEFGMAFLEGKLALRELREEEKKEDFEQGDRLCCAKRAGVLSHSRRRSP